MLWLVIGYFPFLDLGIQRWIKSKPRIYYTTYNYPVYKAKSFCFWKRVKIRVRHIFVTKIFILMRYAVKSSLVVRDGSLKVVGKVRLLCKQSIRVLNSLNIDVHHKIEKKRMQKILWENSQSNWFFLIWCSFPCFVLLFFFRISVS